MRCLAGIASVRTIELVNVRLSSCTACLSISLKS